jgi:hypothetical protein
MSAIRRKFRHVSFQNIGIVLLVLVALKIFKLNIEAIVDGRITTALFIPAVMIFLILVKELGRKNIIFLICPIFWLPMRVPNFISHFIPQIILEQMNVIIMVFLALGAIWLMEWVMRKSQIEFIPVIRPLLLPIFLMMFGAILALPQAASSNVALKNIINIILVPLIAYLFVVDCVRTPNQSNRIIAGILLGGCLIALFAKLAHHTVSVAEMEGIGRIVGHYNVPFFGSMYIGANSLPHYLAVLFSYGLVFWLGGKSRLQRGFGLITIMLILMEIAYANGRGAMVAITGVIIVIGITGIKIGLIKASSLLKITVIFITGFFLMITVAEKSPILLQRMHLMLDPASDANMLLRVHQIHFVIQTWLKHPFTGPGFGTATTHSSLMVFIQGTGPLGAIGIIWFFCQHLMTFWRGLHSSDHTGRLICLGGFGALAAVLIGSCLIPFGMCGWDTLGISMLLAATWRVARENQI